MKMRNFEIARNVEALKQDIEKPAFNEAQIPEYQTEQSAGADFFCAEEVVIPSIWKYLWRIFKTDLELKLFPTNSNIVNDIEEVDKISKHFSPTIVHTGVKACMERDEVLELYNRSSNPKQLGLILANSVGIVDADYYNNKDNDGEIMFAFYNVKPWDIKIKVGERIGQGVFKKYLRPTGDGLRIKNQARKGGFGSTNE